MNYKNLAIYTVVVVAVSVAFTKFYWPNIESQIKIEEKEVIKKDVRTVIKEVTRPDGSKEIITEIVDKSKQSKEKEFSKIEKKKDWLISLGAASKIDRMEPVYSIQAQRRIFGPMYLGVGANTNKEIGVFIGMEF